MWSWATETHARHRYFEQVCLVVASTDVRPHCLPGFQKFWCRVGNFRSEQRLVLARSCVPVFAIQLHCHVNFVETDLLDNVNMSDVSEKEERHCGLLDERV